MRFRCFKSIGIGAATALAAILLAVGACSGSGKSDPDPPDAGDGSDADASPVDCEELQRQYVDSVISPDEQTGVEATVGAVLRAEDFPAAMPFCSGPRPE